MCSKHYWLSPKGNAKHYSNSSIRRFQIEFTRKRACLNVIKELPINLHPLMFSQVKIRDYHFISSIQQSHKFKSCDWLTLSVGSVKVTPQYWQKINYIDKKILYIRAFLQHIFVFRAVWCDKMPSKAFILLFAFCSESI